MPYFYHVMENDWIVFETLFSPLTRTDVMDMTNDPNKSIKLFIKKDDLSKWYLKLQDLHQNHSTSSISTPLPIYRYSFFGPLLRWSIIHK